MSTITVVDNEHYTLYFHEDTKIVHHIYQPTIGGEHLKEELNAGIDLLLEYDAEKWLSDNSAIDGHTDEETEWINTEWLPRAVEAGWKYWALVVPQEALARLNMLEFVQAFNDMGVWVQVFGDPDIAMKWLKKVG